MVAADGSTNSVTDVALGSVDELCAKGFLTGKVGAQPVCVFWHEGRAFAVDDRCPHLGFPLHRGTVEDGLLTCHWHHARFDLASGGTLDPFAGDVRTYPVEVHGGQVVVLAPDRSETPGYHRRRLVEGLEQGLTLVIAKAVLALLDAGEPPAQIVRAGIEFGTAYRAEGWGAGLTVLVAMANVLPHLDPADRPLALVHGLAFVSRDSRGRAPRFPLTPMPGAADTGRLAGWYRRFVDTRSGEAAERVLVTALDAGLGVGEIAGLMTAAATDHILLDGGHTLDFTNKAFEAVALLGEGSAACVLPTLARQTARASRAEESSRWRHPYDVAALTTDACARLPELLAEGAVRRGSWDDVTSLAWALLGDHPRPIVDALCEAAAAGATPEQLGRAVAYAAALRITRFHVQNDHGDWNAVHHTFTAANALHQALVRAPTPLLLRGVFHVAGKVFLDRFLNVPPARLPASGGRSDLAELRRCWDEQGCVDEAGASTYSFLRGGGDPRRLVAALGRAMLAEDAGFHWFQLLEAAVRQFHAWPAGSEEGALVLTGFARFLAAHTPTRRELAHVVGTAARLRRGEALFEEQ